MFGRMAKVAGAAAAAMVAASAGAQVVATSPFVGAWFEDFATTAENSYVNFPVFAGNGLVSRIGSVNALVVNNGNILPPFSIPNAMFGRGADVEWTVSSPMHRFGGMFRDVNAGIPVTQATFMFYDTSNVLIGAAVVAPITSTWTWIGWETSVPFARVEIYGNGSLPGYIGHDDITVDPKKKQQCYADCDGNGVLDVRDFFCFQKAYAAGEKYADCDGNGRLDVRDFFCYQREYANRCR